jgi:hypothetical protein
MIRSFNSPDTLREFVSSDRGDSCPGCHGVRSLPVGPASLWTVNCGNRIAGVDADDAAADPESPGRTAK